MEPTTQLADDVRRVTFGLPLGIDHVHCYFLRAADGSWTLVDTSLGVADPEAQWAPVLAELDGPVERIVVTHYHPDHVGGAADVAALTAATVQQGRLDYEQCLQVWASEGTAASVTGYFSAHGVPDEEVERVAAESRNVRGLVHFARDPEPLEPGEHVDGWEAILLPGHADGHLGLFRDGVLIAGDAILAPITPTVGLWPGMHPDPLGDYLASLARIAELDPAVAYAGHGFPIERPAERAREIAEHHEERLDRVLAALERGPRNAYEVSLTVFGDRLSAGQRRFAVAESLAHLEHLARRGRAERDDTSWKAS